MPEGVEAIEQPWRTRMGTLRAVTSRLFVASDLPALYAIEEACFEPPVRFSRSLMRSLAYDPDCRTWMGMVDNIRAGFTIVGLRGEIDPTAAYIWTLEVLPAFRRLGIARQLLERVEESSAEAGCDAIELHVSERNPDAITLYEQAGFEHIGVATQFYGRGEDGFHYRKQL